MLATETKEVVERPTGWPRCVTSEVLLRLEQAWAWEWSDKKACEFAGISHHTLCQLQKIDKNVRARKDLLKSNPRMMAKRNVAEAIEDGDLKMSQWYLERRDPEFSQKSAVSVDVSHSVKETDVAQQLISFINRNSNLINWDKSRLIEAEVVEVSPGGEEPEGLLDDPLLA